jgi:hypothetical protein
LRHAGQVPWVPDVVLPPCRFCGAGSEHQVLRSSGADRQVFFCLWCERSTVPPPGWSYGLRFVSDAQWRAGNALRRRAFVERQARGS